MCSTRKTVALVGVAAVFAWAGGCVPAEKWPSEPAHVQLQGIRTDMPHDEAMDTRIWDRATAEYVNGNVVAGPTGIRYRLSDQEPVWAQAVLEPVVFLVQAPLVPVFYIMGPQTIEWQGAETPATYDATVSPVPDQP